MVIRRNWHEVLRPLMVGTLVLAAACSSDLPTLVTTSASVPPTSSTGPSPTTVHPTDEARRLALDAYNGMWQAMADAGETSDHASPALARYAAEEALAKITQSLYIDRQRGLVTKGRPRLNPSVSR